MKPPQKYGESDLVAYALSVENNIETSEEPSTYEKAVSYSDSSKWMITMQEKMKSLHKNGLWTCQALTPAWAKRRGTGWDWDSLTCFSDIGGPISYLKP